MIIELIVSYQFTNIINLLMAKIVKSHGLIIIDVLKSYCELFEKMIVKFKTNYCELCNNKVNIYNVCNYKVCNYKVCNCKVQNY